MKDKTFTQGILVLLPYAKPYLKEGIIALLSLIVSSASLLGLMWFVGNVVETLSADGRENNSSFFLLLFYGLLFLAASSAAIRHYYTSILGDMIIKDIREVMFKKLLGKNLTELHKGTVGEEINKIMKDTHEVNPLFAEHWSVALRNLFILIVGVALLLLLNPKLLILALCVAPLIVFILNVYAKKVGIRAGQAQMEEARVSGVLSTTISSIEILRSAVQELKMAELFTTKQTKLLEKQRSMKRIRGIMNGLVFGLVFGGVSIALWFGGAMVVDGTMSSGDFVRFAAIFIAVALSIDSLSSVYNDFKKVNASAERVASYITQEQTEPKFGTAFTELDKFKGSIEFQNVTFAYPSQLQNPILRNINFSIQPGKKIALVGHSGAGKTTIAKLLLRLYEISEGSILIDGVDVSTYDPRSVRSQITYIHQDPFIMPGTIKENILYECNGNPSDNEIWEAIESAQLSTFIKELPNQLEEKLGERGMTLSGGQKQRLAIARSLLTKPSIVILDEPTSALDSETEASVMNAIERTFKNVTSITIAHRLSTVLSSDQILVIDGGAVVSQGTHEQLLNSENGIYNKIADLQFC